jgi:hypothetical protein
MIPAAPDARIGRPAHAWSMQDALPPAPLRLSISFACPPRRRVAAMVAIELAMGLSAVAGGAGLVRDGSGLDTAWIDHTLLRSWTIPGILLAVIVGGGMLAAAAVSVRSPRLAAPAALAMGIVLLGWLAVETLMIGWHGGAQLPLDLLCGGLGAGLVALARPSAEIAR